MLSQQFLTAWHLWSAEKPAKIFIKKLELKLNKFFFFFRKLFVTKFNRRRQLRLFLVFLELKPDFYSSMSWWDFNEVHIYWAVMVIFFSLLIPKQRSYIWNRRIFLPPYAAAWSERWRVSGRDSNPRQWSWRRLGPLKDALSYSAAALISRVGSELRGPRFNSWSILTFF